MERVHPSKAYLEHVAFKVKDIQWHIRFFREVLGMTLRDVDGDAESPRQVWTFGGLQLMADPNCPSDWWRPAKGRRARCE